MADSKLKRYISYFQRLETIGIIIEAEDSKAAQIKAQSIIRNDVPLSSLGENYTSNLDAFTLAHTEEMTSEIDTEYTRNELGWKFNPSDATKAVIASKLSKPVASLTTADFDDYIKDSLDTASIKTTTTTTTTKPPIK